MGLGSFVSSMSTSLGLELVILPLQLILGPLVAHPTSTKDL